jgi:hypothetical protein
MQPTSQDLRRSGACKDCHQRRCSKSMRLRYGTTLWPSTSDRGPTDAASRSSARLPEIRPVDRLGTRHSASHPPIPHSQCASTLISLIRPEAPDFIDTSALRHLKCLAIKVISSAFALPSVVGAFNRARHVPSVSCASKELWELGLTLTRRITGHPSGGLTWFIRPSHDGYRRRCRKP